MTSNNPNPTTPSFDRTLARMIDHTILKPEATPQDVATVCTEAKKYGFASVCVNPSFVAQCATALKGSPVHICSVIGFPLGATSTAAKIAEATQALKDGATEIDMVLHVGLLKAGALNEVRDDIAAVVDVAHRNQAIVKVILETALLTDEEKQTGCRLAQEAHAEYVKTSTGFSTGGATVDDVALMRRTVGPAMGVKASGGIRTMEQARAMIVAGATRIGASASVKIVTGSTAAPSATY